MMETSLDRALALTPLPDRGDGRTRFAGATAAEWWNRIGPFGGVTAALLLRAAETLAGPGRAARALSCDLIGPMVEGGFEVTVEPLRQGKSLLALEARLVQADQLVAAGRVLLFPDRVGPVVENQPLPDLPAPEALRPLSLGDNPPAFIARFDRRVVLGHPRAGRAEDCLGWLRLTEPRACDAALLVAYADAWYPAVWPALARPVIFNTVNFTVYFRDPQAAAALPPDGWVVHRSVCRLARHGFAESDCVLWDPAGRVLAQSTQLGVLYDLPQPGLS